jgi:hypothetical protein
MKLTRAVGRPWDRPHAGRGEAVDAGSTALALIPRLLGRLRWPRGLCSQTPYVSRAVPMAAQIPTMQVDVEVETEIEVEDARVCVRVCVRA